MLFETYREKQKATYKRRMISSFRIIFWTEKFLNSFIYQSYMRVKFHRNQNFRIREIPLSINYLIIYIFYIYMIERCMKIKSSPKTELYVSAILTCAVFHVNMLPSSVINKALYDTVEKMEASFVSIRVKRNRQTVTNYVYTAITYTP